MKVTFLGAGVYGKALGDLAESNGHEVRYYDPYKLPDIKLQDVVKDVDLLVYVAPGSAVDKVVNAKDGDDFIIPSDTPLLCASKGVITPYPFRRFKHFSALNGAAFAVDIATDTPSFGDKILLTASSEKAEELFTAPKIGIEFFEDTRGIMLCGALKVITSVYAGYTRPESFTSSLFSDKANAFILRSFLMEMRQEWEKWLDVNGCSRDLIQLSCGFPDVLLSITPSSRNFVFGQTVRTTGRLPKNAGTIEGLTVFRTLKNYPDLKLPEQSILLNFASELAEISAVFEAAGENLDAIE